VRTLGQAGSTAVLALAASPDGTRIVSVDGGHVIRIWRVADGQLERQIEGPSTTMSAVTFSPDGHLIAVAAADATVHVWDAKSGNPIATIQRHGDMVNSVRFATGGGIRLLTGSDDSTSAIFACQTCESFSKVLAEAEQRDRRP
jgi:WD40 repeat protein